LQWGLVNLQLNKHQVEDTVQAAEEENNREGENILAFEAWLEQVHIAVIQEHKKQEQVVARSLAGGHTKVVEPEAYIGVGHRVVGVVPEAYIGVERKLVVVVVVHKVIAHKMAFVEEVQQACKVAGHKKAFEEVEKQACMEVGRKMAFAEVGQQPCKVAERKAIVVALEQGLKGVLHLEHRNMKGYRMGHMRDCKV